ncbi:omega-amidase [Sarotherodon galilaeus]
MRKRVTFAENLKKENLFRNGSGHILMRSAGPKRRCTGGFECLPGQQVREIYRGQHTNIPAGSQHLKTIHPPKSMMSAPFLQEPAFTGGRTPYLCSIANIYSTEHMRRQMKQHYLNVLHACIQSGHDETRRRLYGDHHCKEKSMFKTDPEKNNATANKQQRQRRSSDRAYSDLTLPKIVNR